MAFSQNYSGLTLNGDETLARIAASRAVEASQKNSPEGSSSSTGHEGKIPTPQPVIADLNSKKVTFYNTTRGGRDLPTTDDPMEATQAMPYENELGMRFVPVPITGGPTDGQRVLFSIWEARVRDYEWFANSTDRKWKPRDYHESPDYPAVNVSFADAQAFCTWLNEKRKIEGWRYQLPTDHEWSCAVGIGDLEDFTETPESKNRQILDYFPWGANWPPSLGDGNLFAGEHGDAPEKHPIAGFTDGAKKTSATGVHRSNRFGLFDLAGNAQEWCADSWKPSLPEIKILRGSSWFTETEENALSSFRYRPNDPSGMADGWGFRVVFASSTADHAKPTNAPTSPRPSGRLQTFGNLLIDEKSVPISVDEPNRDKLYVSCLTGFHGWLASVSNGGVDFGSKEFTPSEKLKEHQFVSLAINKAGLNQDGVVVPYSDDSELGFSELKKVQMFDANFRHAVAVFEDGSCRIWNIKTEESETVFQPTKEDIGQVAAVCVGNGVSFLRQDGSVYCVDVNGPQPTGVESEKFAEIDSVTNGLIGLTIEGRILSWGAAGSISIPENLPKAVGIRGGGRMAALQKEDGTWMAFGHEPEWKEAVKVAEKIAGLKNPIDLDLYCNGEDAANLVWIEPVVAENAEPTPPLTGRMPVPLPAAADPLADPITTCLAEIEATHRERYATEVAAGHSTAVKKLDAQIGAAFARARDAAATAGELDAVLAWRRAIERLERDDGVPTPEEIAAEKPEVKRPERLLQFRATYRTELAQLETQRDQQTAPIRKAWDTALDAYQRELTRASKIEDVLTVKAAREAGLEFSPTVGSEKIGAATAYLVVVCNAVWESRRGGPSRVGQE